MNPSHDHDEIHYMVGQAAVGIVDARCDHGDWAIDVVLAGTPCKAGALPDTITAVIPRCGLADIIGSVIAQIRHHEGPTAAHRFRAQIALAETAGLLSIQQPEQT
ncbi:hypothetical protein ACWD64_19990 [Streptomyces antibioticus]